MIWELREPEIHVVSAVREGLMKDARLQLDPGDGKYRRGITKGIPGWGKAELRMNVMYLSDSE